MHHILLDGWFVHIPFGSMIKFHSLAQFLLDHPFHPVISGLAHILC